MSADGIPLGAAQKREETGAETQEMCHSRDVTCRRCPICSPKRCPLRIRISEPKVATVALDVDSVDVIVPPLKPEVIPPMAMMDRRAGG